MHREGIMSLLEYFEALPEEKKILQLGIKTDTPLANAFPYKRLFKVCLRLFTVL